MAVSEADLDAFVVRTCQQADPGSGITPRSYSRDTWAQLHQADLERQAAARAGSALGQLQRELAELRRQHQRLRIEIFGTNNATEARSAGFRPPPAGAPGDGTVIGLPQLILHAIADALGETRVELERRIAALEQRPVLAWRGLWQEGTVYRCGLRVGLGSARRRAS